MTCSVCLPGLLLALAAPAWALDITTCHQRVPDREHAVLQVDLDCSGLGTCREDPSTSCFFDSDCPSVVCERGAVNLGKKASLDLNGHSIVSTLTGVFCGSHAPCFVAGPGRVSGGSEGIRSHGSVVVTNVDIENTSGAIEAFTHSVPGTVTATGVTITHCGSGIVAGRIRAATVMVQDGTGQDCSGFCTGGGPSFGAVRGTDVTIIDGAGYGIAARRIVLANSTVTGNHGNGDHDLLSVRRPLLVDSTCGRSEVADGSGASWGVCSGD